MKLYNTDHVLPRIKQQIKKYVEEYGYTYSGIMKALIYYYEIKGNKFDFAKTNGGIGIVPFVYQEAQQYFKDLERKQKQIKKAGEKQTKVVEKIIEISIPEAEECRPHINVESLEG